MLFVKVTENSYFTSVEIPESKNMFPKLVNVNLLEESILNILAMESPSDYESASNLSKWIIDKSFLNGIPHDFMKLLGRYDTIDLLNDFSNTINPYTDSVKKFLTENDLYV